MTRKPRSRNHHKLLTGRAVRVSLCGIALQRGECNPTKDQYKAVYDVSEGDILEFQNFHSSWKNVSHNLAPSNAVIGSTGVE